MCCEPSISSAFPTPEIENLVAGPGGGLTLTTPNAWLPFPFQTLRKLGLRWPMRVGREGQSFPEKGSG